ncbi:MAG TPA: hypothetical protein VII78_01900 [Myxococcota bacterium]|jgi:hypothetical protein
MQAQQPIRVHRAGNGYCFEAPGIYLWDEDRSAVERAALAWHGGAPRLRPTRRMLVIPPQEVAPPQR